MHKLICRLVLEAKSLCKSEFFHKSLIPTIQQVILCDYSGINWKNGEKNNSNPNMSSFPEQTKILIWLCLQEIWFQDQMRTIRRVMQIEKWVGKVRTMRKNLDLMGLDPNSENNITWCKMKFMLIKDVSPWRMKKGKEKIRNS
jgi:hypothetical protein